MSENLTNGIRAFKDGDRPTARRLLILAAKENPTSERAWGWLYNVAQSDQERRRCLEKMLSINPANQKARSMLEELNGEDFPLEHPPAPQQVPPSSSLDGISIMLIVILILLSLFWFGIGGFQFLIGLGSDSGQMDYYCSGGWNFVISVINLLIVGDIVKRSKNAYRNMIFLALIGTLWGGFQMVSGVALQACVIPFYITLGVLAYVNKAAYTQGK